MYSPTSRSLLPTPLGSRDLFTTGPDPTSGGSKPGENGWTQMPEKFGVAAAPCAPLIRLPEGWSGRHKQCHEQKEISLDFHADPRGILSRDWPD